MALCRNCPVAHCLLFVFLGGVLLLSSSECVFLVRSPNATADGRVDTNALLLLNAGALALVTTLATYVTYCHMILRKKCSSMELLSTDTRYHPHLPFISPN